MKVQVMETLYLGSGSWSPINIIYRPSKISLFLYLGKSRIFDMIEAFGEIIYNINFYFKYNKEFQRKSKIKVKTRCGFTPSQFLIINRCC